LGRFFAYADIMSTYNFPISNPEDSTKINRWRAKRVALARTAAKYASARSLFGDY
jgi:hypothetical protein